MPIFSTYSQKENRVTSTFLEVLQHLPVRQIDRIISELTGETTLKFIDFKNQPTRKARKKEKSTSVPDARIKGGGNVFIETKIKPGTLRKKQLLEHLKHLDDGTDSGILLALTPDDEPPEVISDIAKTDSRLRWANFQMLDSAIDDLLSGETDLVSEKEHFLLYEFRALLNNTGLLRSARNTVIVPARGAWEFYLNTATYVCQPNRSFRSVDYLGFYVRNSIQTAIPKILKTYDEIILDAQLLAEANYDSQLVEKVETITQHDHRLKGGTFKVMLLSAKDDDDTKTLNKTIENNLSNSNGRRYAFTQNQRYVNLDNLVKSESTYDLLALEKTM